MTSPMHARKAKLKTHLISAKAKLKHNVTPRRVFLLSAAATSAFLLLFTIRTLHSAASRGSTSASTDATAAAASTPPTSIAVADHADHHQEQEHHHHQQQQQKQQDCVGKQQVPASVASALVHYATSSSETPPRQTEAEASAAARVLSRRAPCALLVFGLGHDSALWAALNHGGRTLFLDADADRVASARATRPAGIDLQAHTVTFQPAAMATPSDEDLLRNASSSDCAAAAASTAAKALAVESLERSACALAPRGLPAAFYEAEWDVIVVGAPPAPGAIYTAAVAARARRPGTGETTGVLVHGVDSAAEERLARAFLCQGYLKEEAGRLRHFAIPSHRDKDDMPFCP